MCIHVSSPGKADYEQAAMADSAGQACFIDNACRFGLMTDRILLLLLLFSGRIRASVWSVPDQFDMQLCLVDFFLRSCLAC
jgi:hypothetical protein